MFTHEQLNSFSTEKSTEMRQQVLDLLQNEIQDSDNLGNLPFFGLLAHTTMQDTVLRGIHPEISLRASFATVFALAYSFARFNPLPVSETGEVINT